MKPIRFFLATKTKSMLCVVSVSTGSGNISVFVDQRARLRFLPAPDFYGSPQSLRARAWDGVTRASPGPLGVTAVLTSDLAANVLPTSMSLEWQSVSFSVLNVADRVTVTSMSVVLDSIPYRIRSQLDRVFAVEVERNLEDVRHNISTFSAQLSLSLGRAVTVRRTEPLSANRLVLKHTHRSIVVEPVQA